MKLKNRKILYNVTAFSVVLSGFVVDKIITLILILSCFIIVYFDKEFRKGTLFQSNIFLFAAIILDIILIAWLIRNNYLS